MITATNWCDEPEFNGHGNAIFIVTTTSDTSDSSSGNYEIDIDGYGLGCYSKIIPIRAYIWDKREFAVAREYYKKTFVVGTIWKLSGKIEYEDDTIIFVDPVYMPYTGEASKLLVNATRNPSL